MKPIAVTKFNCSEVVYNAKRKSEAININWSNNRISYFNISNSIEYGTTSNR